MDDRGAWGPAPPDTHTYVDLGQIVVDGETFVARQRDDGSFHYGWISVPNDGYGFSTSGSPGSHSHAHHAAAIRDFLAGIDPATGYLAYP